MGRAGVQRAADIARQFQPDLVVLTGDFVSHPFHRPNRHQCAGYAEPCADVLAAIKDVPKIAILGNHDHWTDPNFIEGALKDRGIAVLRNAALPLERGSSRLWISGVDDVLVGAADLSRALRTVPESEATVLLAHEPDFADEAAARFPIDLQLSGHSHGGQVR
jgi:predicted MPP superfamily phosphohydrolase